MNALDKAYLAGFFDGEGSIGLYKRGWWNLQITVAQNTTGILQTFFDEFPRGSWSARVKCQCVVWYGLNGEAVLDTLYPYLRVKKEQAALAMEYCEMYRNKQTRRFGGPYTAEEVAMAERIAGELRRLKRGI